jgi:hypothetical protein
MGMASAYILGLSRIVTMPVKASTAHVGRGSSTKTTTRKSPSSAKAKAAGVSKLESAVAGRVRRRAAVASEAYLETMQTLKRVSAKNEALSERISSLLEKLS